MQYRLKVPLCAKFMHSETLSLYFFLVVVAFVYSRCVSVLSRAVVNFVNLAHSEGEILSASGAWSGVVWRKTIFIIFFYITLFRKSGPKRRGERGAWKAQPEIGRLRVRISVFGHVLGGHPEARRSTRYREAQLKGSATMGG